MTNSWLAPAGSKEIEASLIRRVQTGAGKSRARDAPGYFMFTDDSAACNKYRSPGHKSSELRIRPRLSFPFFLACGKGAECFRPIAPSGRGQRRRSLSRKILIIRGHHQVVQDQLNNLRIRVPFVKVGGNETCEEQALRMESSC